jgi:hypothetical protein
VCQSGLHFGLESGACSELGQDCTELLRGSRVIPASWQKRALRAVLPEAGLRGRDSDAVQHFRAILPSINPSNRLGLSMVFLGHFLQWCFTPERRCSFHPRFRVQMFRNTNAA